VTWEIARLAAVAVALAVACWSYWYARRNRRLAQQHLARARAAAERAEAAARRAEALRDRLNGSAPGDAERRDPGPQHGGLLCITGEGWLCCLPAGDGHDVHVPYVSREDQP
jgi:hypothetical protein